MTLVGKHIPVASLVTVMTMALMDLWLFTREYHSTSDADARYLPLSPFPWGPAGWDNNANAIWSGRLVWQMLGFIGRAIDIVWLMQA